uniref:Lipoprotein n=1 Tax=Steinernema glaseri TaxID=37863 RepID=A0A1I7Z2H7_9BILA
MSALFLLLLCFVGLLAQDGRTFRNAKLSLHVFQETADCFEAGTDCDVTIRFGFTDRKDQKLRYVINTPGQKGNIGHRFERGITDGFKHDVPNREFRRVEDACARLATNASGFHSPIYNDCFTVNRVYFETFSWWGNIGADWKPGNTFVALKFTFSDGSEQVRQVTFKPLQSCSSDWVESGGHHFLCSGEEKRYYRAIMARRDMLELGDILICPTN